MTPKKFSEFSVRNAQGQRVDLQAYADQVVLVVNTASACAFTPQYAGLQRLFEMYHARGLRILAFPCNQFLKQEPGTIAEIQDFCQRYEVGFPILDKVNVNGEGADPLWAWLKSRAPGIFGSELVKWNFTKFLVARDGTTVYRFAPRLSPEDLIPHIEKLL